MRSYLLLAALPLIQGIRIIQSNDDGWAESNIRTLFHALWSAGHEVVLSAPAENKSGSGSSDGTAVTVGKDGCQYKSCPGGSPATGADPNDPRLNYVNGFPVTSIKNGIDVTCPKLWKGAGPELAITGPNVGKNVALAVQFSGTVGAADYAAKAGIPAIAFSGTTGEPTSFMEPIPLYSQVYADLALNITSTIINSGAPYLPEKTWLNVNFPEVTADKCNDLSQFKFIFTRINWGIFSSDDAEWCGTDRLPQEADVIGRSDGCYVSISPGEAGDKTTVNDKATQLRIIYKLRPLLSCLP